MNNPIVVVPTYREILGQPCTLEDLINILQKHPVSQWLSFLSRLQTAVTSNRLTDQTFQQEALSGTYSKIINEKLKVWESSLLTPVKRIHYFEQQLSILQELAIIHSNETSSITFADEEFFYDFNCAVLMVNELLLKVEDLDLDSLISLTIRSMACHSAYSFPALKGIGRVFMMYEIEETMKSSPVQEYFNYFKNNSSYDPTDFIMGGMYLVFMELTQSATNRKEGWQSIGVPEHIKNSEQKKCIEAYLNLCSSSIAKLKEEILQIEELPHIENFNLIPISKNPIIEFSDSRKFVLNVSALGRSVLHGIYYRNLNVAGTHKDANDEVRRINGIYGDIFEEYVHKILKQTFFNRVIKIPFKTHPGFADFIVLGSDEVLLIEVKGRRFSAFNHFSALTIDGRKKELEKSELRKGVNQLLKTIQALHEMKKFKNLGVPDYNWKCTRIVPIFLSEELFPNSKLIWEHLYHEYDNTTQACKDSGPIGHLRLMSISDLELLPDIHYKKGICGLMSEWSEAGKEYTFQNFLLYRDISIDQEWIDQAISKACKFFCDYFEISTSSKVDHLSTTNS